MMTEISLESVARKIFEPIRLKRLEKKKRVHQAEHEKVRVETKVEYDRNPESMPNSSYFKEYFNGGVVEDLAKKKDAGQTLRPVKRFKFEEDPVDETQEIVQEILREQEEKDTENGTKEKKKPFRIEDVKTGVLTELPDEKGNFKEKKDGEFEPPSMVQMEEKVDVLTQSAIDAGVPLDRAVEVGKRMSHQEVQQAADSVNAMAKENIEATKLLNYKLPSVSLLAKPKPMSKSRAEIKQELEDKANKLLETLASFKVEAKILNITQGPSVTRFELQPGFGIKVSKITNLADDIALSLAASGVRIEAPIPGKSAIGIEIPNETPTPVPIREVIDTDKFRDFKSKTAFALGKDISGNCVIADVASFPHILIAGATGSGKSVCINSLITSILYKAKPDEVKMIMVDPKMVELGVYNGIPHLLIPVVTDPKHAAGALNWAVAEMKNRYQLMKDNKVRNIQGYNELMVDNETPENKLPEIVIIIDELADLMLAAKNEVEDAINSLAALARAAGMYLVIATQRPSVDVITGVIKANVPSRISFAVSSQVDSRTILDSMGAEKLLGKGDMLYAPRGANKPMRIQGNFLSDDEIEGIISYIKQQYEAEYDESILEHIEREQEMNDEHAEEVTQTRSGEKDSMFYQAAEYAVDAGQASVAMLQRRYKIGYQRAARIIDQLEENRIIGPYEGTKPRQVLITRAELNEMMMNNSD
ncbi:MAG: DNA translocase FtsK [Clostridia bacterium]|nr:DNA translocase FtsK [Clostridia bacterium]